MKDFYTMSRKGQSAIEYLTTYGWALLAIVIVGAVLSQMGVFNQCQQTTPQMSGQSVAIGGWSFVDADTMDMTLSTTNVGVNITNVSIAYSDGRVDNTFTDATVESGQDTTVTLTGLGRTSGQCASGDVLIEYETLDSDRRGTASGTGLRGPVP